MNNFYTLNIFSIFEHGVPGGRPQKTVLNNKN